MLPSRTHAPLLHFFLPAEPEDLRPCAPAIATQVGVIGIEHGKISALLVFENARLGVHVNFKAFDGDPDDRA